MPRLIQLANNISLELCDGFMIGRSLDCFHVIEDISISRKHCVFTLQAATWYITDLSSNGIFINSLKIEQKKLVALEENDHVQMGNYSFRYTDAPDPPNPVPNYGDAEVINIDESFIEPEAAIQQHNPDVVPAPIAGAEAGETNAFEEELTCSICTELFINAVTLNCQHTYCKLCIFTWRKNNKNCPICRKTITTDTPCMALNNMVALTCSRKSQEEQNRRAAVVSAHEEESKKVMKTEKRTTTGRGRGTRTRAHARFSPIRTATRGSRGRGVRNFEIIDLDDLSDSSMSSDSIYAYMLDTSDDSLYEG